MRVKATREGLIGHTTASGYVIDKVVPFVALPSRKALNRFVRVANLTNGKASLAWVADVGPWNENDDLYVFSGGRPQAESGIDTRQRPTNKSGIDLGEAVWRALGMTDDSDVEWEFI
jgi:hypothetical protein